MRQVHVQVPAGYGEEILRLAAKHGGMLAHTYDARDADSERLEVILAHLPNRSLGSFIDAVDEIADVHMSVMPQGVIALSPPATEVPAQVRDVSARSPIEIFLDGVQSVGSWKSFLAYAALAGGVVWLGLLTNAVYLLVAAMLIAPFAGPAMNTAIATARGDAELLLRALARYVSSLAVTSAVAGVLTWLFRLDALTAQMADAANISSAAVVLPLAAGAAGALHLVQGERSNLVSGASVGMLVAASLAPPAGLLGMAVALAEWDLVPNALFLLSLQLVGINLAGAAVFRMAGLGVRGPRYSRGRSPVAWLSAAASVAALVSLLGWQLWSSAPTLQRSSLQQRVRTVVQEAVDRIPGVELAAVEARFTRPEIPHQRTLLLQVYIQRSAGNAATDDVVHERVRRTLQDDIQQRWSSVTPLVDVTLLTPPSP
jgi:uncharacterized hydrophobic protein (TIGR00271 family)